MLSKSSVKYIQSLQQKKFRDEHRCFVAEGPKVVGDLLRDKSFICEGVYATADWSDTGLSADCPITVITGQELERISGMQTPNQVLAIFKMKEPYRPVTESSLILVLDTIQDPGNLGTLLRTADWFGVCEVVCSHSTADMYNPKTVQSSMASIGHVNVLYTDIVAWLKNRSETKKWAASLQGSPLTACVCETPAIIIIGNESTGISKEVLALADEKISIPGWGKAESLNAGVAAGILLHEFARKYK